MIGERDDDHAEWVRDGIREWTPEHEGWSTFCEVFLEPFQNWDDVKSWADPIEFVVTDDRLESEWVAFAMGWDAAKGRKVVV